MTDILTLQTLPKMDSMDLDSSHFFHDDGCSVCSHTCCCTAG